MLVGVFVGSNVSVGVSVGKTVGVEVHPVDSKRNVMIIKIIVLFNRRLFFLTKTLISLRCPLVVKRMLVPLVECFFNFDTFTVCSPKNLRLFGISHPPNNSTDIFVTSTESCLSNLASLYLVPFIDYLLPGCAFYITSDNSESPLHRLCSMPQRGPHPFHLISKSWLCSHHAQQHIADS